MVIHNCRTTVNGSARERRDLRHSDTIVKNYWVPLFFAGLLYTTHEKFHLTGPATNNRHIDSRQRHPPLTTSIDGDHGGNYWWKPTVKLLWRLFIIVTGLYASVVDDNELLPAARFSHGRNWPVVRWFCYWKPRACAMSSKTSSTCFYFYRT